MSAVADTSATHDLRLSDLALAAVADVCPGDESSARAPLDDAAARLRRAGWSARRTLEEIRRRPLPGDDRLIALANALGLTDVELMAVALAAVVEDQASIGRVLAHVQAPIGGSRPTLGLIARAFGGLHPDQSTVPALLGGEAVRTGLLTVLNDGTPLAERAVMVPAPLCMALAGVESRWPGTTIDLSKDERITLPDSFIADARRHAGALAANGRRAVIARTGSRLEGRNVACAVASALSARAVFVDTDQVIGLGPWMQLCRLIPVFCYELAPGERRRLPDVPGHSGPVLIVCGPDGSIEVPHCSVTSWPLSIPSEAARHSLWIAALGLDRGDALIDQLARDYRHSVGRIAHVGRTARHYAALAGRCTPEHDDVVEAAWTGEGNGIDALAEALRSPVPDDALVVSTAVREQLESLISRCRRRESLADGLGVSARTRYRPGVRALFTGPSGTGKTLAAGWIASRLGFPLYRVDLASVTSKYIGETEKNLSLLLARAEHAEVIVFFDEADALFGKRTDIGNANDRFANAQTNYLLQRIEQYDGIVVLTSNSQERFDEAFARRLDFIVDFPLPGPEERRALWKSHLGSGSTLSTSELNALAVLVDLSGGHTRNAVLAAAVRARHAARGITFDDVLAGVEGELRKLGRQMPVELARRHSHPATAHSS